MQIAVERSQDRLDRGADPGVDAEHELRFDADAMVLRRRGDNLDARRCDGAAQVLRHFAERVRARGRRTLAAIRGHHDDAHDAGEKTSRYEG